MDLLPNDASPLMGLIPGLVLLIPVLLMLLAQQRRGER